MKHIGLALIALIGLSLPANAQWFGVNIDGTEAMLQNKLNQGRTNGRLTWSEAQMLQRRLNNIMNRENRLGYDGLSPWERRRINMQLQNLNSQIDRQLWDSDRRWNRWWY